MERGGRKPTPWRGLGKADKEAAGGCGLDAESAAAVTQFVHRRHARTHARAAARALTLEHLPQGLLLLHCRHRQEDEVEDGAEKVQEEILRKGLMI